MKCLCKKKEPRDSVNGIGYGNSTSMVLFEGKKTSGEEVSIRLAYALWTKDRPTVCVRSRRGYDFVFTRVFLSRMDGFRLF
jgi:hypothetical protein